MSYKAYPYGRWLKWGVVVLLVVILLLSSVSTYNGLVGADQNVQGKWGQVEVVMQERSDKIVNLVEVVKGYTKHEEKVFSDIAAARSVLYNAGDVNSKLQADDSLNNSLRQLLVIVENYPDLKADSQYHDLAQVIDESENKISQERRRFNEAVQSYNLQVKRFPGNIFAGFMGFGPKDYFQSSPGAAEAPKVNFD